MLGPTLLEYGSEESEKTAFAAHRERTDPLVRRLFRAGAGSDLAGLQTRCEDAGDHWLVNGQKVWTSGAQFADWCFCLVRTDPSRKHDGISFVLIDMRQPGVEARPIRLISGASPFCELFLVNARVEKNDMVGPLNGGWTIGKKLLQHERSSQGGARTMGVNASLSELAKTYVGADSEGRLASGDLRRRLTQHLMEARAHALTMERVALEARSGQATGAATSMMKISSTRVGQERSELALEIMGAQGLGWEADPFTAEELAAVRGWLVGKASTIAGGSLEIQNNIIAKRILGLPDPIVGGANPKRSQR